MTYQRLGMADSHKAIESSMEAAAGIEDVDLQTGNDTIHSSHAAFIDKFGAIFTALS